MEKTFRVPNNINLAAELRHIGAPHTPAILDKYHYLLNFIYVKTHLIYKGDASVWIRVSSKILVDIVGPKYGAMVRKNLVKLGILECDGRYTVGGRSMGYRFGARLKDIKFTSVPVYSERFKDKLVRIRKKQTEANQLGEPQQYVSNWIRELEFAADDAQNFIDSKYCRDYLGFESRLLSIEAWRNRDFLAVVDKQGRFYHNYVLLAKELRQFATLNGAPLVQCDYSACQLALLGVFYPSDSPEKVEFAKAHAAGFYQFLADKLLEKTGEYFDLSDSDDKAEFKDKLFKDYLFWKNSAQSPIRSVFESEFPELGRIIVGKKAKDHGDLPRELQKLEAMLVLDNVIPKLMGKFPGIPLVSVHDCVATTAEFIDQVKTEMSAEFLNLAGFRIGVKTG